ncbi:MAG TPA: hypothetical protein VGO62_09645, partial [Myxococcota bacterium]
EDRPREPRPPREDRPREDRPREPRPPRDARPHEEGGAPVDINAADTQILSTSRNLYITLGREDGVPDMTALIKKLSEMSGVDMGHFTGHGDVRDHSSHVEVDLEVADQVVAGVNGKPRGDKTFVPEGQTEPVPQTILCELARSQGGDRGPRRGGGSDRDRGRGGRGRGPRRDRH